MRLSALLECNGFREDMTAGEEPELCWRLQRSGWRLMRLDLPMALHDAAMTRFTQWWKRSLRSGHAAAQLWDPVSRVGTRHGRATITRAVSWGILLPIAAVAASFILTMMGREIYAIIALALPLVLAAAQVIRMTVRQVASGSKFRLAATSALFNWISKTPEGIGVLQHWLNRARGQATNLVEYKPIESGQRSHD